MKKILGIMLLTAAMAGGGNLSETAANPGLLDDPGCQNLILNQLRDAKQDPKDYTIVYYNTSELADKGGAINEYLVTKKSNGKQVLVAVAVHFEALSPSPSPSASPSLTPATQL